MQPANSTPSSPQHSAPEQPELSFRHLALDLIMGESTITASTDAPLQNKTDIMMPLIVAAENDRFRLIDGYKRFAELQRAGAAGCDCGIVSPAPDSLHAILLRVTLNRGRTFTTAEKLQTVAALATFRDTSAYREACAIITTDRSEISHLEKCATCSPPVLEAVARGYVDLPLAPVLDQFAPSDLSAVLDLYARFPFSRQTQKEFSDWLPELGFRERCPITEIISSPEVQEIIVHPKLNAPQKIEKLRQNLYERRFPTIIKAKKTWESRAAAINPDTKAVVFKAADAFEKNRLEIKITITSAAQAQELFSKLSTVPPPAWDQLIYPAQLYGDF